jgi:hypothetical protein
VTRALMREAGVSLSPRGGAGGTRWSTRTGALLRNESSLPHAGRFYRALAEVKGRDAKGCVEIVDPPFESEVRFAGDSPVEGDGFEPSVPRETDTARVRPFRKLRFRVRGPGPSREGLTVRILLSGESVAA